MKFSLKKLGKIIIYLISEHEMVPVMKISEKINKKQLISYLEERYEISKLFSILDYKDELDEYFFNYAGISEDDADRKYGIIDSNDGLLLVLALIFES